MEYKSKVRLRIWEKSVFGQAVNCLPDEILQIDKPFGFNAAISDRIP